MKPTNRATFLMGTTAVAASVGLPGRLRAQTATLTTLRLGTAGNDDATPIVYGQKAGIFAKYGLNLDINKNPGPAAAALLGGSYDLGKSAITSMLQAHQNNVPLNLIAAASVESIKEPYAGFLIKKDSPAKTGKDLNNQLIGLVILGSIGQVAVSKWVDEHGGDYKSVKWIEVPTFTAAGAVDQGRVYASECTYPAIAVGLQTGTLADIDYYATVGNGTVLTAWAATKDFSAKNPQLIRAFARAWREAVTYTNAHRAETVADMADFTGIEAAVLAKMPRATASPTLVASQVQPMIDAAAKYGVLKEAFPAADLIDPNIR
jgi:ABC-type nitrate/sulfonate/bicarbonate transport system substrate-binding protein